LDVRMLQGKADGLTQPDPMCGAHIEPTGPQAAILGGLTIGPRRSNSEIVGGIGAPGKDRPASLALDPKDDGQELTQDKACRTTGCLQLVALFRA
jgi:hypothetical protein